jgi:hypothetical protein
VGRQSQKHMMPAFSTQTTAEPRRKALNFRNEAEGGKKGEKKSFNCLWFGGKNSACERNENRMKDENWQ